MLIELREDAGQALQAKVEVHPGEIIVHSRGGAYGKPNLRNPDYRQAVRSIFDRLKVGQCAITGVWLDSAVAKTWPVDQRIVLTAEESTKDVETLLTLIGQRGAAKGRPDGSAGHGNSTKRIKIGVAELSVSKINLLLTGAPNLGQRLPASTLREVTAADIDEAVARYLSGAQHGFSPSSDYDLVIPGDELAPPKAIFGLALERVIGRPAEPGDFTAGWHTPCFELLEAAGYPIIEKAAGNTDKEPQELLQDDEAAWAEGAETRLSHLRRERARGLASAKRRSFVAQHGHLFCERCQLVPSTTLGVHGDACIEVHHSSTVVATMKKGHVTRLKDLQCLCANCHRIVHRELVQ